MSEMAGKAKRISENYDVDRIIQDLNEKGELDPDSHDGSYEMMREMIQAYARLQDLSVVEYHDLNMIYLTSVGTWKHGLEAKKKTIDESHIRPEDKEYLKELWDKTWEKAGRKAYSNYYSAGNGIQSIGMFGTGFYSFQNKTTAEHVRQFIQLCIDLLPMENDDEMYKRAESVLVESFKGMAAASASMVLHCLKPYTFPILNSNMGNKNIFEVLGIPVEKCGDIATYIGNCRKIKAFRDEHFACKNYRIFDMAAWDVDNYLKNHKTGRFDSWEIVNEDIARKICDKSFFQYRGAAIPQGIRWFFRVEAITLNKEVGITLVYQGVDYAGRIRKTDNGADQTRLFWDAKLAEQFAPLQEDDIQDVLEFRRSGLNRYEICFIAAENVGRVWLIAWNQSKWHWDNYAQLCEQTKAGQVFVDNWACSNRNAKVGEEVFLIKLGEQPRGIIGHGFVTRESYTKEHYDPEKAAEGKKEQCIDVKFDRLIDYEKEKFISQDELNEKCPQQHWSPQNSGIEIKAEVLSELRSLWHSVTQKAYEGQWGPHGYDPGITVQKYHDLFVDEKVVMHAWLVSLYEFYTMPDHAGTCKQVGEHFGYGAGRYISHISTLADNIIKATNCNPPPNQSRWPVLCWGKPTIDRSQGVFCWKLREPVVQAIEMLIDEGVLPGKENREMVHYDHNMILYGPPGTGKTYNSVNYAVAICENKPVEEVMAEPYDDVLLRYKELKEAGRVEFTTFHQSYGYEEFIEGIKPKLDTESETLGYTIEDGVFKDFCRNAGSLNIQSKHGVKIKDHPRIWLVLLEGPGMTPLKRECFEKNEIRIGWSEVADDKITDDENISWRAKQMLHAFTYEMEPGDVVFIEKDTHSIDAIGVIAGDYEYDRSLGRFPRRRKVEWIAKDIYERLVQYLPKGRTQLARVAVCSIDYLGTEVLSEILRKYMGNQGVNTESEVKPYVFIIDEINRGNISKIFGELITLIEDTKRAGAAEAMEAVLPYSGELFSVPGNVYIIGTMNTADRSIALMDTALRRRFDFIEMMPDSSVLVNMGADVISVDGIELNVARMLDVINERIACLFDREHTIGHAYFTKLAKDPSIETLARIFEENVIPLLQEYFYEDYEKIQLVLGDNTKEDNYKFVLDKAQKIREVFNGTPDIDIQEKRYIIQHEAFLRLESYKQIGKDL